MEILLSRTRMFNKFSNFLEGKEGFEPSSQGFKGLRNSHYAISLCGRDKLSRIQNTLIYTIIKIFDPNF